MTDPQPQATPIRPGETHPSQAPPAHPGRPMPLDEQAKRLADFFNGEVIADIPQDGGGVGSMDPPSVQR